MEPAPLKVTYRHLYCGQCKMKLENAEAISCEWCGTIFDSVESDHIGLANVIRRCRGMAVQSEIRFPEEAYPPMVSS